MSFLSLPGAVPAMPKETEYQFVIILQSTHTVGCLLQIGLTEGKHSLSHCFKDIIRLVYLLLGTAHVTFKRT